MCVSVVELFIQVGSIIETQHGFCHEMNWHEALFPNAIPQWVRQWREEGSVACKKLSGRPSSFRTPKNIVRVLGSIVLSLRRSASKHAEVLGMSDMSVQHILQSDLNLHPHKLQALHPLNDWDQEVYLQVRRHFRGTLHEDPDLPDNLLWEWGTFSFAWHS